MKTILSKKEKDFILSALDELGDEFLYLYIGTNGKGEKLIAIRKMTMFREVVEMRRLVPRRSSMFKNLETMTKYYDRDLGLGEGKIKR